MTKQEAINILETAITESKYDQNIRSFINFYHKGGIHKLIKEKNMKIEQIIAFTETKVKLPKEVKEALYIIFNN